MIECGVVIDKEGCPFHWHLPPGRTAGSIPDTRNLWDVFWEHRENLMGFAHSHPGSGIPGPSQTDLSTFVAIEAALGQRLDWWITSSTSLIVCNWVADERPPWGKYSYTSRTGAKSIYQATGLFNEPQWVDELRAHSA